MIIIEFFGPPGSGKSYFKKKLIKNFSFKIFDYKTLYNIISDRNLFLKLFYSFIKQPYIQNIKNNYFINKVKKNFYGLIKIKKIEYDKSTKPKNRLIEKTELIKKLINKSQFGKSDKKTFENWANEEIYANHYAKKNKERKILIDSEGLIQRLFIYCYKKKNKKQIIKKYLNLIELPKILIFFSKKIVNKKNEFTIKSDEEEKIFKLVLLELKKKNILTINSKIGINKTYLKIKKKLK